MSAPDVPQEAVSAVQKALGCREDFPFDFAPEAAYCLTHDVAWVSGGGCPVAVAAADAAVDALGLTEQVCDWECSCGGIGYVHHHDQPSHVATTRRSRVVGPWVEVTP